MFFQKSNMQFTIREVFLLQRKNEKIFTAEKKIPSIGYRLSGEAEFYYKNEFFPVKQGDALYVPSGVSYQQKSEAEQVIVIHFDVFEANTKEFSIAHFQDIPQSKEKFLHLLDVWNSRQPGYQYRATAILYDILADAQQLNYSQNEDTSKTEFQLAKALEYLHRNYYKSDLNIKDIAAASNISEVYFRRLFQENYQTSPLKYINNLRISKAMTLLKTDDSPIKTIAAAVGFSDPLYFSKVFKKMNGMSPAEFRTYGAFPEDRYSHI